MAYNQIGDIHIARQIMAISSKYMYLPYIQYFLEYMVPNLEKQAHSIIPGISRDVLLNLPIPLPPLAEQRRIVAKIEELMPLVEKYGKAQTELDTLNQDLPRRLRQSVLQQAIQGKLVEQDEKDEPASVLLERIRKEKEQLVKEGKLKKKDLATTPIADDEIPFDIPSGWEWCRICDLGITNTGSTPSKTNPSFYGSYIPFVSPGDIQNNKLSYRKDGLSELGYQVARPTPAGTILQVCIGGSIGKCAICDREITFNQQINSITPNIVDSNYIHAVLSSNYIISIMKDTTTGSATPIINKSTWENLPIPLSPLAEQRRIVAKIEELFAEIDKLK